jgi:hypothetical protein
MHFRENYIKADLQQISRGVVNWISGEGKGLVAGSSEHGNEFLGPINAGKFIHQFLKNVSSQWSYDYI